MVNRETFYLVVDKKVVWYKDRKWNKAIRCVPKDEDFIRKIIASRNKYPQELITLFELNEEEKKEYENAQDDVEISEICIKDVRKIGGKLVNVEKS